jgi:hypothetical protein
MSARRFPPPWSVEETDACFIVRDANGQALAYVLLRGRAGQDGGVPLVVVLNYSHGERRARRTAQAGRGGLERVA